MNRSPLSRTAPLTRDPRQAADWQQRSRSRLAPVSEKRAQAVAAGAVKPAARTRSATGFSPAVKLAVRKRAGDGHVEDARCECCGIWLGRYGGQIQHIVPRGMGGTSNPVLSTAADAALLCGTPQSGDHGLAESRDPEMRRRGFWLPQRTDPRTVPMVLWSGRTVWRSENGHYLDEPPEGAVAA